jgi:hypothetical protein
MVFASPDQHRSSHRLPRWHRFARTLALAFPLSRFLFPTATSLPFIRHGRPEGSPPSALLVFLQGNQGNYGESSVESLIQQAWDAGLDADGVEVDSHLGLFLRQSMVMRLKEDVVDTARKEGYRQIWLVGLSTGGTAALAYARTHPTSVEGIVLLAPDLGHRRFIERIRVPCADYHAPSPREFQHELWEWLAGPTPKPPIYLGFGVDDKYATCHRLVSELLPKGRVFVTPGGHDWPTWVQLWATILPRVITQPSHWA